jgi:flagellar M-ring protein FliF
VVLSRPGAEEAGVATSSLDAKQSMEAALRSKLMQLLDQMFKPGDAMVSVDVSFNHQHSKVTTEELLTPAAQKDQLPSGVVVRERSVTRERAGAGAEAANAGGSTTSQELDYQTGRRVSQISQGPGEVSRITVGVVLRAPVSELESQRLTSLVSAAVGLQASRGDQLAIYAMNGPDALARVNAPDLSASGPQAVARAPIGATKPATGFTASQPEVSTHGLWLLLAGALLALVLGLLFWKRRPPATASTSHGKSLSDTEREHLLRQMKQWLGSEAKGQEP